LKEEKCPWIWGVKAEPEGIAEGKPERERMAYGKLYCRYRKSIAESTLFNWDVDRWGKEVRSYEGKENYLTRHWNNRGGIIFEALDMEIRRRTRYA